MIDLRIASLKITVLTFSMVSVMACKKIFLKPQPVVQENDVKFSGQFVISDEGDKIECVQLLKN